MIRADIIKIYKTVHTWTGIICGFALFIAFYAGALTMFKEPIARWASPPSVEQIPLADANRLIELVAAAHPGSNEDGITLHLLEHENEPARVTWEEDEPHAPGEPHGHVNWWATLKPDGTLLAKQQEPSELAQFIDELHRTAGIPGPEDFHYMGVVSLLYAVALISGVIILLPSLVKDFFLLRVGRNLKRMWLDAHNIVGIISLPFHLVMALTAVGLLLRMPIGLGTETIIYGEERLQAQASVVGESMTYRAQPTGHRAQMLPPETLVQRAKQAFPDLAPQTLTYTHPGDEAAAVRVSGIQHGYLGGNFAIVTVSAVSGEVLMTFLPSTRSAWYNAFGSILALHFGNYGGATTTWSYFFLGLAGAWLFYSGNLLWIETRRKKARKGGETPEQRRDTYWLGAGTVGVCLGCVAGISLTIVAAKWLHGHVADLNHWHEYIYYAVFFGSVAWAFAWGAARSAVHLLWLCAGATMAIPLTTVLAALLPALGMWAHGSAATIGVDVVAFVGALCFAWMAIATTRRIRNGRADSIWSIRKEAAAAAPREPVAIPAE